MITIRSLVNDVMGMIEQSGYFSSLTATELATSKSQTEKNLTVYIARMIAFFHNDFETNLKRDIQNRYAAFYFFNKRSQQEILDEIGKDMDAFSKDLTQIITHSVLLFSRALSDDYARKSQQKPELVFAICILIAFKYTTEYSYKHSNFGQLLNIDRSIINKIEIDLLVKYILSEQYKFYIAEDNDGVSTITQQLADMHLSTPPRSEYLFKVPYKNIFKNEETLDQTVTVLTSHMNENVSIHYHSRSQASAIANKLFPAAEHNKCSLTKAALDEMARVNTFSDFSDVLMRPVFVLKMYKKDSEFSLTVQDMVKILLKILLEKFEKLLNNNSVDFSTLPIAINAIADISNVHTYEILRDSLFAEERDDFDKLIHNFRNQALSLVTVYFQKKPVETSQHYATLAISLVEHHVDPEIISQCFKNADPSLRGYLSDFVVARLAQNMPTFYSVDAIAVFLKDSTAIQSLFMNFGLCVIPLHSKAFFKALFAEIRVQLPVLIVQSIENNANVAACIPLFSFIREIHLIESNLRRNALSYLPFSNPSPSLINTFNESSALAVKEFLTTLYNSSSTAIQTFLNGLEEPEKTTQYQAIFKQAQTTLPTFIPRLREMMPKPFETSSAPWLHQLHLYNDNNTTPFLHPSPLLDPNSKVDPNNKVPVSSSLLQNPINFSDQNNDPNPGARIVDTRDVAHRHKRQKQ